jgi:hypothetical protein
MHTPSRLLPAVLIAASMAVPAALAQQPVPPGAASPAADKTTSTQTRTPKATPLLSVEFSGGTLGQFVDAVKAACPEPLNVIVPAEAIQMPVPHLSLKSISPQMALQSLEYVNDRNGGRAGGGSLGYDLKVISLNNESVPNAVSNSSQTFAIAIARPFQTPQYQIGGTAPANVLITRVYSVSDLLSSEGPDAAPGLSMDQIVQPVETALTVDNADGPPEAMPKVMVHKDSRIIIVRGTSRQNDLAKQVIERLREDVESARERVRPERELREAAVEVARQRKFQEMAQERMLNSADRHIQEAKDRLVALQKDPGQNAKNIESAQKALADAESYRTQIVRNAERDMSMVPDVDSAARNLIASRSNKTAAAAEVRQLRDQIEDLKKQIQDLRAALNR